MFRVSLASIVVAAAVIYTWFYFTLPKRYSMGGVRISLVRRFTKDFQPYFFAPAGFVESIVVRVKRAVSRERYCPEVVVLSTEHRSLRFRATVDLPPMDAPLPLNTDILQFAAEHPPWWLPAAYHPTLTQPDGTRVPCKYWDCDIDRAEDFLRDKYARPYTLSRVLRWYEETRDERTRIHLLMVLAASRDPRAGLVAAGAIDSTSLELRVAAVHALNTHFVGSQCGVGGNLESAFREAFAWLEENEGRLRKEANKLPRP